MIFHLPVRLLLNNKGTLFAIIVVVSDEENIFTCRAKYVSSRNEKI